MAFPESGEVLVVGKGHTTTTDEAAQAAERFRESMVNRTHDRQLNKQIDVIADCWGCTPKTGFPDTGINDILGQLKYLEVPIDLSMYSVLQHKSDSSGYGLETLRHPSYWLETIDLPKRSEFIGRNIDLPQESDFIGRTMQLPNESGFIGRRIELNR